MQDNIAPKEEKITSNSVSIKLGADMLRWLQVIAVSLVSMAAFETVAVTTAMPYVMEDLQGEYLYALASGIALATQVITTGLAGKWCDTKGPHPALYTGLILFISGLLIATFSPNAEILVLGRGIQGLGGGLLIVPLYVLAGHYIPPEKQANFFASLAAAWVLPALVGPAISGALVEYVHWRWVFGITPFVILAFLPLIIIKVRAFPHLADPQKLQNFPRVIFLALGTGIAVSGLQILSGVKAENFSALHFLGILLLTSCCFLAVRPLLPPYTLRAGRGLPASVLYRGMMNGAYVAVELFLPLLLKNVHNFSPTRAGIVLTIGSVTWAAGSFLQGKIHNPNWRKKMPLIGSTMQIIGIFLTLPGIFPAVPGEVVFAGWLIASLGVGIIYPGITVYALALTPKENHGRTSSALQILDSLGAAICIAYAGIIFALCRSLGVYAFGPTIGALVIFAVFALLIGQRIQKPGSTTFSITF